MWDEMYDFRRAAKRDFRRLGIALLLQELFLLGTAYAMQDWLLARTQALYPNLTPEELYERLWNTGLDMIVASAVGLVIVLVLLGGRLRGREPGEPMSVRQFVLAVASTYGLQLLMTLVSVPLEHFVESMGYSLEQAEELATGASVTVSMLVYSVLLAPLVEELVFRGAVLRWLEPWGRGFALFASAMLFGLMHGNLVQLPVAVACGVLFGYLAQRFSLRASFAAHVANNLLIELIGLVPDSWDPFWMAYSAVMLLSAAYLVYWCLTRRAALAAWCRGDGLPVWRWFLTSVPVLVLLLLYVVRTLESALPV